MPNENDKPDFTFVEPDAPPRAAGGAASAIDRLKATANRVLVWFRGLSRGKQIAVVIVALMVVGAILSTMGVRGHSSLSVGEIHTVSVSGGGAVPIAISSDAMDRLRKLAAANDSAGVDRLEAIGWVFGVPSGTRVRIISTGVFTVEVRVVGGSHDGYAGFVDRELIE